jgi:hypothetical protein
VHLVPSLPPAGTLEVAPRTSLRQDSIQERWDGFWCVADDRYYARCTRADGRAQWFRFAEERVRVRPEARVLPLRHRTWRGNRSVLLVGAYGGRAIIVGRSRRRDRTRSEGVR